MNYVGRSARHFTSVKQLNEKQRLREAARYAHPPKLGHVIANIAMLSTQAFARELLKHSVMRNMLSPLPGGMARTSLHWNGRL